MMIRPLSAAEAPLLRELRLRALQDSPDSFGPAYDDALLEKDAYWESWASGGGGRFQAFAAFDAAGTPIGLVSASARGAGVGGFGALWVAPEARGSGLGREMVEAACAWAADRGCTRIEMSVTDGNPAERLYESLGFARTGERHPLRPGSPLVEVTMARGQAPGR